MYLSFYLRNGRWRRTGWASPSFCPHSPFMQSIANPLMFFQWEPLPSDQIHIPSSPWISAYLRYPRNYLDQSSASFSNLHLTMFLPIYFLKPSFCLPLSLLNAVKRNQRTLKESFGEVPLQTRSCYAYSYKDQTVSTTTYHIFNKKWLRWLEVGVFGDDASTHSMGHLVSGCFLVQADCT